MVMLSRAFFNESSYNFDDEFGYEFFRMERSYFRKDFRISHTDTSYQVLSFTFTSNLANATLDTIPGCSEGISADGLSAVYLRLMTKESFVAVENIIVSKNGNCYKVPSFFCYMLK